MDTRFEEIAALIHTKREIASDLLRKDGVIAVGVGYDYRDKNTANKLGVVVFTDREKALPSVVSSYQKDRQLIVIPIPRPIVRPLPPAPGIMAARDIFFDSVKPGIQIQAAGSDGVGTLGAIVYRLSDSQPLILSNWHIMAAAGVASGIPIHQPLVAPGNEIGVLYNAMLGATRAGWLDAAVAELNDVRPYDPQPYELVPPPVPAVSPALLGLPVIKTGRTTEVTQGLIGAIDVSIELPYEGVGPVPLERQFAIVPDPGFPVPEISEGGDSGSVWLDASNNYAVGLHFAGEGASAPFDVAFATPIGHVNRTFDIRFGAVDDVPQIWRWWNGEATDHYYTRTPPGGLPPDIGWEVENDVFSLFQAPGPGLTLLYEWYNGQIIDHFYTTDPSGELAPANGYELSGPIGYICQGPAAGLTELYRWWHPTLYNHFYTADPDGEIADEIGYIYEGIVGWVQPLVGFP